LPETWQVAGFGLYIHWPFCQSKCPYCDFNSHVADTIDSSAWRDAYLSEVRRYGELTQGRILSTVFFGGGTPSLMDPDLVNDIMSCISETWALSNNLEVTLEANPGSVEASRFAGFRQAGVSRVSLGVQALNDNDLRALGRLHSANDAIAAIDIARRHFDRVSFDLIYARQNQSLNDWQAELNSALALSADHLSLYQLTIEPGTAFGARHDRGLLPGLPPDDLAADMYLATQDVCSAAGLPAYETSNHARPGSESRHNLIYWRAGDYIGIGPGAHGRLTLEGTRWAIDTPLGPAEWLKQALTHRTGDRNQEVLSPEDQASEYAMMCLRLSEGLDVERYSAMGGAFRSESLNALGELGLIELKNERLVVTKAGRPVLNAILRDLLV